MSNITQFSSGGSGGTTFNRREIIVGPVSTTWTAGSTGIVEVNCWGGGGNGGGGNAPQAGGGGGGGGYVRYIYDLTAGDQLSITVGGSGGTSSVSCPTQSPTSPISATGGSAGGNTSPNPNPTTSPVPGGAGGTGSGTVPAPRIGYLITRSGGSGSIGDYTPGALGTWYGGGGGSAGSEYGDGISNTGGPPITRSVILGGAGIGGKGLTDPSSQKVELPNPDPTRSTITYYGQGGPGNWLVNLGAPTDVAYTPWFKSTELIGGGGGSGAKYDAPTSAPTTRTYNSQGDGGFLAGGSGGVRTSPLDIDTLVTVGTPGGYGGGGGGIGRAGPLYPAPLYNGAGGVGFVMIYYTI
jgi:hypothetical protein